MVRNNKGLVMSLREMGLLILLVIFLLIALQIKSFASDDSAVTGLALAKDVAKSIDAFESIPQNIHFEYPSALRNSVITIKKNKVAVLRNSSLGSTDFSLQASFFKPSTFIAVEPIADLDTNLFSINKDDKKIYFVSGFDAKFPLQPKEFDKLTESLYYKNDTIIYVNSLTNKNNEFFLNYFKQSLINNLEQNNFTISNSSKNASLIIELQTSKFKETKILYSEQNSYETEKLSDNILKVLPDELNPESSSIQSDETTLNSTIFVQLGTDSLSFLEDDANKRFIARYLAIAINKFYK